MSSTTVILEVDGMSCDACARNVTRKLTRVPGVESAEVTLGEVALGHGVARNPGPGRAVVHIDPAQSGVLQLIRAVEQLGYHAVAA